MPDPRMENFNTPLPEDLLRMRRELVLRRILSLENPQPTAIPLTESTNSVGNKLLTAAIAAGMAPTVAENLGASKLIKILSMPIAALGGITIYDYLMKNKDTSQFTPIRSNSQNLRLRL